MKTEWLSTPAGWQKLQPHPLAELVEFGAGIDVDALADHMRRYGYDPDEAIVLYDDGGHLCILDGRHKHAAAIAAGLTPTFKRFCGKDPIAYVCKKAFRQHLKESQRAMIAASLSGNGRSENSKSSPKNAQISNVPDQSAQMRFDDVGKTPTQEEAAKALNVSRRSVQNAAKVKAEGTKELNRAVVAGDIGVTDAAKVAKESPEVQNAAVDAVKNGKAKSVSAAAQKHKEAAASPPPADEAPKDKNGDPFPPQARPAVMMSSRLRELARAIDGCRDLAQQIATEPVGLYLDPNGIAARMEEAKKLCLAATPAYVCRHCKGKQSKCPWCKGNGWQTKGGYKQCPEPDGTP